MCNEEHTTGLINITGDMQIIKAAYEWTLLWHLVDHHGVEL